MLGIFGSSARFAPDHPAFIVPDGPVVSYGALSERVAAFSARLSAGRGLIEIVCDGHLNQYIAYLGALQARCPVILSAAGTEGRQPFFVRYTYVPGRDALDVAPGEEAQDLHPDLALLLSTSGSTGAAKAVRLSRANLEANAVSIAEYLELSPSDRAPMALPFQYSYGLSVVNSHLAVGATLVLTEGSVSEPAFWAQFRAARCSSLAGVPHTFELMEQAGIDSADLTDLRYMTQAGGKLAAAKVAAWSARAASEGWSFVVMYGQTEAAPRISYLPPARAAERPGAIGVAIPGGRLSVLDEAGQPVPDGTTGELVYQGPNVMMGYATQASDLALGQGPDVLHTGDLAVRHPDGLFEIVGRASRFVKLFGYRIGLDALETRLAEEGIEAAAHASGDALSVLVATGPEDPEAQRTTARTAIARITSLPPTAATILTTDKLPRTENGKIDTKKVKNIIQNAQASAPKPYEHSTSAEIRARELQAIWAELLGLEHVGLDQSFYDLGGDSLSSLTATLQMEAMGLDRETARGLFEGRTIAEIVGLPAGDAVPHETRPGLTRGQMMNAVHAVRGLIALLVIVAHWMPGLLNRIATDPQPLQDLLNPLFRYGTPGFALVFGIGVGAIRLEQYASNQDQFRKGLKLSLYVLLAGVSLLALMRYGRIWADGGIDSRLLLSGLFYSAVTFYLLAILSLPLWMWFISRWRNMMFGILSLAVVAMVVHEILMVTIAPLQPAGPLEFAKVLMTGKFGYFRMTAYVMVGIAIGYALARSYARPDFVQDFGRWGLLLTVLGGLLVYEAHGASALASFRDILPWHLTFYAGVTILILAGLNRYYSGGPIENPVLSRLNAFVIASGILALPLFVGHSLVIPGMRLLEVLNVPGALALALPMGIFFCVMAVGYQRLLRVL